MSSGQRARTPANYPHMKYRAAGRIAARQQAADEARRAAAAARALSQILKPVIDTILQIAENFKQIFQRIPPDTTQADVALAGPSKQGTTP